MTARVGLRSLATVVLISLSVVAWGQPEPLFSADLSAQSFDDGYAVFVSPPFGERLAGNTLTIEVNASSADGSMLGAKLLVYDEAGEKIDSVGSLWGRQLSTKLQTCTDDVRLEDPRMHSARLAIYRSNKVGTLLVHSAVVRVAALVATDQLVAELEAELRADGYQTRREGDLLVGIKPDERCYWRTFPGQSMKPDAFRAASDAGATWVRSEFQPDIFPTGPYVYGRRDFLTERARAMGLTLDEFLDYMAADVAAHGANTIYYANLTTDPELFRSAVAAAQKHGVSVFGQLTSDLYLRVERDREYYERVTLPAAREIIPQYRDLPGVLGWMGKEEPRTEDMPLVAEYRAEIRRLDPTHAQYTAHNHLAPFRAEGDPLPEWFGFDRYRFRCLKAHYGLLISTPRDMATRLREELRHIYPEAQKRGRPLIYILQSYGHENRFTTEEIVKWSGGARDTLDPWSGFREVEPGVWQGWDRYPPPPGGMFLQCWLAVSEGARGLLAYHYWGLRRDQLPTYTALVDELGRETRLWREWGECLTEMTPLMPLFSSWHKEALPGAETDNPQVKVRSFIRRFDAERYLVVMNERIATWDDDSPALPRGETELHFDDKGLAGLHEASPLDFSLTVTGDQPLWDVRTGERLQPGPAGSHALTLGPGRGTVLMQGSAEALGTVRTELGFDN